MPEFDDLATQLMLDRPDIDADFARMLDERAAAGFPPKRRRPRVRIRPLFATGGGLALAGAAAVVLAVSMGGGGGDTASDSSGGSTATSTAAAPESEVPAAEEKQSTAAGPPLAAFDSQARLERVVPKGQGLASNSGATALDQAPRDRVQEVSTALTLETPPGDIAETGDEILQVVAQVDGFVESSNVRATDGESGSGSFEVRIPVDRLEDGLARLSRLGHVRERTSGSQDITSERNVAREQLQESKAVRQSLLTRLEAADTDTEVEALRAQLRSVNGAIGTARASLRQVERRAAYSRVSVTLLAADKQDGATGGTDDQWTPGDAFRDAGRVLEVVAGVVVVAAAVLVPLVLLLIAVVVTRRALGRRGRERALDAT